MFSGGNKHPRRFSQPLILSTGVRFQHGLLVKLLAINADASGMDARQDGRMGAWHQDDA